MNTRDTITELKMRFYGLAERAANNLKEKEPVDLLRAINSYRIYPSVNEMLSFFPELYDQREYIVLLWKHFDGMTNEELAEMAIEMIQEAKV